MAIPKLPADKCQRANRLASQQGVDTAPLRFLSAPDAGVDFIELKNVGRMPETPNAALSAINAMLPEGATPLAPDDVYIHYLEAASSAFIPDRSMYLGKSTLQNITKGAAKGVAFMNSHRTGGMSAAAELPYGKTFAGQLQTGLDESGNNKQRAVVGAYMLAGTMPNGSAGPSTDDLNRLIKGGIIADVSVGLYGGQRMCNVCGNDLFGRDEETGSFLCPHVPGTHFEMSDDDVAAERERDPNNTEGFATFTLEDAFFSEVSAVYDGAVPGAGVKKVLSLGVDCGFDYPALQPMFQEAVSAYGHLLPEKLTKKYSNSNKATRSFSMAGKQDGLLHRIAQSLGIDVGDEDNAGQPENPDKSAAIALQKQSDREAQLQREAETAREQLAQMRREASESKATASVQQLQGRYLENGVSKEVDGKTVVAEESDRAKFTSLATPIFAKAHAGEPIAPEELTELLSIQTGGQIVQTAALSPAQLFGATVFNPDPKPDAGKQTDDLVASIMDTGNSKRNGHAANGNGANGNSR